MTEILKQSSEEDQLLEQLKSQEKEIRDAFLLFISITTAPESLREINNFLALGDLESALSIVDDQVLRLSTVVNNIFVNSGRKEVESLVDKLGRVAIGLSFDPADTQSAAIMQQNQLQFVREIGQSQRDSTRQALTTAFETGAGPRQTATAFKNSIGLTARQEQAVLNYRTLLENNSAQALTRDIRDRRFDRTVRRAIENDQPLKKPQIDKMVDRYRERFLQFRAETVARTEGLRATSLARDQALRQTIEATGIDPTTVVRTWNVTSDNRLRDIHATMRGQKVGLDELFIDGDGNFLKFPGDPSAPADTVINCRCVVTNGFKS